MKEYNLMLQTLLDSGWYNIANDVLSVSVGLMHGTELIADKLKKYGCALIITTLTQSPGTFVIVSAVFAVIFAIQGDSCLARCGIRKYRSGDDCRAWNATRKRARAFLHEPVMSNVM